MEKLIEIQNELKVPKGNINKFGNYKYRSAEDILEAVKPILFKHKAILFLSDDIVSVGNKILLKATATLHVNSSVINVFGYAELSEHKGMSAEQATGTASSYARKYALNGLFLIDETEADADNDNVKKPVKSDIQIEAETKLNACSTQAALKTVFFSYPVEVQKLTEKLKDELKAKLPA